MTTSYGRSSARDFYLRGLQGEVPLAQITKDFGLSDTTLKRWITIASGKESAADPVSVGVGRDAGAEEA